MKNIPEKYQKYFWDCDLDSLNIDEYDFFIIERILNFGNMDSIKWLLSASDLKRILFVVKKSRNLDKKTRNYWNTIFG